MASTSSGGGGFDLFEALCSKNMAVLARCPRLQTLNFNLHHVADLSPLASCVGLRRVTIFCSGDNLAPFVSLKHLEHLECSQSAELADISALAACTALKYLDCNYTRVKQLPPLPRLETLICFNTPLTDISALVACTALKCMDCRNSGITTIPPLPASLEILRISGTLCADLSPLAACVGLRSLDCRDTSVRNLLPLLACKQLEVLECSSFGGIDDQISQLLQARPGLNISIDRGYVENAEWADEGDEEDWGGYGDGGDIDYEMEGYGFTQDYDAWEVD